MMAMSALSGVMRRPAALVAALLLALTLGAPACGPDVDVKQAVQIAEISGGWFDAGIKDGKNKLVPSVSFRVKKSVERRRPSPLTQPRLQESHAARRGGLR